MVQSFYLATILGADAGLALLLDTDAERCRQPGSVQREAQLIESVYTALNLPQPKRPVPLPDSVAQQVHASVMQVSLDFPEQQTKEDSIV